MKDIHFILDDQVGEKVVFLTIRSIVNQSLPKIHKTLAKYLGIFFAILAKHMTGEFEVQIRDGKITDDGKKVLRTISAESVQFQYKIPIHEILTPWIHTLAGHPMQVKHQQYINNIIVNVIKSVEKIIVAQQQDVLKARRISTHKLCKEKCETGPAVHNFTSFNIPDELKNMLGPWLQVVPGHVRPLEDIKTTIISDVKKAAIAYFQSTMGYKPAGVDSLKTIDETLKFLSMKTPCGSPMSEFYFKLRDTFVSGKNVFLNKLKTDNSIMDPTYLVQRSLPDDIVITPTDKNLGVALVPIAWYQLQYDSQCKKRKLRKDRHE